MNWFHKNIHLNLNDSFSSQFIETRDQNATLRSFIKKVDTFTTIRDFKSIQPTSSINPHKYIWKIRTSLKNFSISCFSTTSLLLISSIIVGLSETYYSIQVIELLLDHFRFLLPPSDDSYSAALLSSFTMCWRSETTGKSAV